ncbi:MAG: hypothetical protein NC416_10710 [Eubacterium sp.]|nr:hypothetical protein [Eubacterium sp.]
MDEKMRTQWHSAFYAATRLELRSNVQDLIFEDEFLLNTKPLQVDLLVIKKTNAVKIQNEIGRLFEGHNLIEYKSPDDSLGIDCFFKTYGYACIYKASSGKEDGITVDDVTITFIRYSKPYKLIKWLQENEYGIEEKFPGIYYISKKGGFKIQIIVSKYISSQNHSWLAYLKHGLQEAEAIALLKEAKALRNLAEHEYADSVLQVAVQANRAVFNKIKEESEDMCEALRELMAPEFEQAIEETEKRVTEEVTKKVTKEVTREVTKEVTEEVTKEVTEKGIKIFVIDGVEEGRTEQVIIDKLVRLFHIDESAAREYFTRYSTATV